MSLLSNREVQEKIQLQGGRADKEAIVGGQARELVPGKRFRSPQVSVQRGGFSNILYCIYCNIF